MSAFDRCSRSEGYVQPYLVDAVTGEKKLLVGQHNTILHDGNHVLARLMSGSRQAPSHIGFVVTPEYGTELENAIDASSTLDELFEGGSLLIAPLVSTPAVSRLDDGSGRSQVVFTSHTGAGTWYGDPVHSDSMCVRRAVLLSPDGDGFIPFSAVDLGSMTTIPAGGSFHFGLYWTIVFGADASGMSDKVKMIVALDTSDDSVSELSLKGVVFGAFEVSKMPEGFDPSDPEDPWDMQLATDTGVLGGGLQLLFNVPKPDPNAKQLVRYYIGANAGTSGDVKLVTLKNGSVGKVTAGNEPVLFKLVTAESLEE